MSFNKLGIGRVYENMKLLFKKTTKWFYFFGWRNLSRPTYVSRHSSSFSSFFMKKSIENILIIYVIIMLFGILSKREFLNVFFNEFSSFQRSFTFCKIRRLLTFFPFPLFFYWHVLWTLSLLNLGGFINKTSQVLIQSYHHC